MNEDKKNFEIRDDELGAVSGGAGKLPPTKTCPECHGLMMAVASTIDGVSAIRRYCCINCDHKENV